MISVVPDDFPDDAQRTDHRAVLAQFAPGGEAELAGEIVTVPLAMPEELAAALTNRQEPTVAPAAPVAAPSVSSDANLRSGPRAQHQVIGGAVAGQRLQGSLAVVGQSADGQWLALADGSWIAASLVTGAPGDLPAVGGPDASGPAVEEKPAEQQVAAPVESAEETPAASMPATDGGVLIETILYDGDVPDVESDEYIVLLNRGAAPVSLGGWRINAGDEEQDFWLPEHVLPAGGQVRVYTNEVHPETGGLSFDSGKPVWRNSGDCGYLFDAGGTQVSEYCY